MSSPLFAGSLPFGSFGPFVPSLTSALGELARSLVPLPLGHRLPRDLRVFCPSGASCWRRVARLVLGGVGGLVVAAGFPCPRSCLPFLLWPCLAVACPGPLAAARSRTLVLGAGLALALWPFALALWVGVGRLVGLVALGPFGACCLAFLAGWPGPAPFFLRRWPWVWVGRLVGLVGLGAAWAWPAGWRPWPARMALAPPSVLVA